MNDLDVAVSVLAVVALPLIGIGPMLQRLLGPAGCALSALVCSAAVYLLTAEPWATVFTACLAIAVVLPRRPTASKSASHAEHRGSALR